MNLPRSAMYLPGFGIRQPDHRLGAAFAHAADDVFLNQVFAPVVVEEAEGYTVVPPFDVQLQNPELQKAVAAQPDVSAFWSQSQILGSLAYAERPVTRNQRLVLLAPSLRPPKEFLREHGKQPEGHELEFAEDYEGPGLVLDGPDGTRSIIASHEYIAEVHGPTFDPVVFAADLLNKFTSEGGGAMIVKAQKDTRLGDQAEDFRRMRSLLTAPIGFMTVEYATHAFTGKEEPLMRAVVGGEIFDMPHEMWSRDGSDHQEPVLVSFDRRRAA